ncbi:MAG: hypothetical protein ACI4DS_04450, partial [Eubacterium sp.]
MSVTGIIKRFNVVILVLIIVFNNLMIVSANDKELSIIIEPQNQIVKENENAVFSIEAKGTGCKYLWMRSKDGGSTWEKAYYNGYLTSEMTVPVKSWVYDYLFYCQVTDKDGNVVSSDIVKAEREAVKITTQPSNIVANINENAVFSIEAKGTGCKYLWMRSKDGGSTWEKAYYNGYLTSEMTVPVKSWVYDYLFYCQVTDKDGNIVTSDIIRIYDDYININNDLEHIYSESISGTTLIGRDNFLADSNIDNKTLTYECNPIQVDTSDMMILRFTAYAYKYSAHVIVNINDGEYNGSFSLVTEETEYYLSVTGMAEINNISIRFTGDEQII